MAFINHDYVEEIWRVMFKKELRVFAAGRKIKRLVGGDQHARILLRIPRINLSGVRSESCLEIGEAIISKLGPIAEK